MKKTVFVLLILFIILISGCVKEEIPFGKPVESRVDMSVSLDNPCNHLEDKIDQTICLTQKAKDEKNISFCYFFERDEGINSCIFDVAREQDNQTICGIIENPEGEDWCYFDFVLLEYGDMKRNCIKFSIGTEECRNIQQKMDSACGKIKNTNIKNYCVAVASDSKSKCNEISDSSIKVFCNNFFSE